MCALVKQACGTIVLQWLFGQNQLWMVIYVGLSTGTPNYSQDVLMIFVHIMDKSFGSHSYKVDCWSTKSTMEGWPFFWPSLMRFLHVRYGWALDLLIEAFQIGFEGAKNLKIQIMQKNGGKSLIYLRNKQSTYKVKFMLKTPKVINKITSRTISLIYNWLLINCWLLVK